MSVEDVDLYPPSRVFTQGLIMNSYYPYLTYSTDSLEAPESISARIRNLPARRDSENLCQHVFNKLKEWFNRFLSYFS